MEAGPDRWAGQEFGATDLGDVRRTRRLVIMAARAATRPSGKVSAVFDRAAEREGAYDFLENPLVEQAAIAESVFSASVARARGNDIVYVAVDGSALSLADENGAKGFGQVGSPNAEVRGLKVMNALGVTRDGVPVGLVDQIFWNRGPTQSRTAAERLERNRRRAFEEKETKYFIDAAENASRRLESAGVRPWVVIDREGDDRNILLGLHRIGCVFTVRSRFDRRLRPRAEGNLHALLDAQPTLGSYEVEIGRTGRRAARHATVEVRAAQVTLQFNPLPNASTEALRLFAVRLRERRDADDRLDWILYTNVPVLTQEQARHIVESYRARWRVEEFHRTWKQGECNVEDAQLRSVEAVTKWATLLAAVATRIERLKYLSRNTPDAPASVELDEAEIEALRLDQRRRMRPKRERIPEMPTIGAATQWLAELGGWIGPRNGPAGSITIARGLERLAYLVDGIAIGRRTALARAPT